MTILARLLCAIDAAIDTVINAVTDVLIEHWIEAEPSALCGNPTKANEQ